MFDFGSPGYDSKAYSHEIPLVYLHLHKCFRQHPPPANGLVLVVCHILGFTYCHSFHQQVTYMQQNILLLTSSEQVSLCHRYVDRELIVRMFILCTLLSNRPICFLQLIYHSQYF